jgi:hypothetical protein
MRQPLEKIGQFEVYQSVERKRVPVCSGGHTEVDFPVADSFFLCGPEVDPHYLYPTQEAAASYARYLTGVE